MPDEAHRKSESIWKTIFWSKLYLHFRALVGRRIWTHVLVDFALRQNRIYTSSVTGKAKVTFFIMIKAKFLNWVFCIYYFLFTQKLLQSYNKTFAPAAFTILSTLTAVLKYIFWISVIRSIVWKIIVWQYAEEQKLTTSAKIDFPCFIVNIW